MSNDELRTRLNQLEESIGQEFALQVLDSEYSPNRKALYSYIEKTISDPMMRVSVVTDVLASLSLEAAVHHSYAEDGTLATEERRKVRRGTTIICFGAVASRISQSLRLLTLAKAEEIIDKMDERFSK